MDVPTYTLHTSLPYHDCDAAPRRTRALRVLSLRRCNDSVGVKGSGAANGRARGSLTGVYAPSTPKTSADTPPSPDSSGARDSSGNTYVNSPDHQAPASSMEDADTLQLKQRFHCPLAATCTRCLCEPGNRYRSGRRFPCCQGCKALALDIFRHGPLVLHSVYDINASPP